jgi:hypothetical protein
MAFRFDKAERRDRIEAISRKSPTEHTPTMQTTCKHPKVRIVAREDRVEYFECLECGEVFDSEELRDVTADEKPDEPAEEE